MTSPRVSVVLATCFQPVSLRLILAGYRAQTWKDFELILADDGSGDETTRVLDELKPRCEFPIQRVWQPNRGFRKSRALNHGVFHSRGSLLVFSDGDCIPAPDFLKLHVDRCPADGFSVGGWVNLTLDQTQSLSEDGVERGDMLRFLSPEVRRDNRMIHLKNVLYGWFGKRRRPRIRGRNVAVARAAYFRINGFDEHFDGFGKEDSDLRDRLKISGFRGVSLYGRSTVFHTENEIDKPYQTSMKPRTDGRDYYGRPDRTAWCGNGLFKRPPEEDASVRRIVESGGETADEECARCTSDPDVRADLESRGKG